MPWVVVKFVGFPQLVFHAYTSTTAARPQNLDVFASTTLVFDRYASVFDELTTAGNNL